jgi:putative ABC transport system substrate-binding protein
MAAKNATRDIPIVMAPAGDAVALGFIASLARPGGNITGLSSAGAEAAAKSLELIPDIVPAAGRVGVLGNAHDPFVTPFLEQIRNGAAAVRLDVHPVIVRGNDSLDGAFAAIARERADAVVVQGSLPDKMTVDLAIKYRLPSIDAKICGACGTPHVIYREFRGEGPRDCGLRKMTRIRGRGSLHPSHGEQDEQEIGA